MEHEDVGVPEERVQPTTPHPPDTASLLTGEIAKWRDEGLIDDPLTERLLARYEGPTAAPQPSSGRPDGDWPRLHIPLTPGMVLLYLGGILVLTASLMVVANVWNDLGRVGCFLIVAVPTATLYALAARIWRREPERRLPGLVLAFFAAVLFPFAARMAVQLLWGPHLGGTGVAIVAAAVALAAHLVTLAFFRSPVFSIPWPASLLWLFRVSSGAVFGWSGPAPTGASLVAGMTMVAVGVWLHERDRDAYAHIPDLVGAITALGAVMVLGADGPHLGWQLLTIILSLVAIIASVWRRNQVYLFVGAGYLIVGIFNIGFEYSKDSAGLPLTLLACGAAAIIAGYTVQRLRREYILPSGG